MEDLELRAVDHINARFGRRIQISLSRWEAIEGTLYQLIEARLHLALLPAHYVAS
jgi:hypothetical protein